MVFGLLKQTVSKLTCDQMVQAKFCTILGWGALHREVNIDFKKQHSCAWLTLDATRLVWCSGGMYGHE